MGKAKLWQVAVIIAAVVVVALAMAWMVRKSKRTITLKDQVVQVDVVTGDLFRFDTGGRRGIIIPGRNPETNSLTLLPVVRDAESGKWYIEPNYRGRLQEMRVEPKAVVDARSGEVRISSEEIRPGRP